MLHLLLLSQETRPMWLLLGFRPLHSRMDADYLMAQAQRFANVGADRTTFPRPSQPNNLSQFSMIQCWASHSLTN
jgi:hypothetical protein